MLTGASTRALDFPSRDPSVEPVALESEHAIRHTPELLAPTRRDVDAPPHDLLRDLVRVDQRTWSGLGLGLGLGVVVLSARRPRRVVRGLGCAFLYLSISIVPCKVEEERSLEREWHVGVTDLCQMHGPYDRG